MSLTGSKNAFDNLGSSTLSSTARYGCCDAGSYMANPELNPFVKANACQNCPANRAGSAADNDDTSCCALVADGTCTACNSLLISSCTAVICNAGFYESGSASNNLGCSGVCAIVPDSTTRTCGGADTAGIQSVACNASFYETGAAGTNLGCSLCDAGSVTNTGTSPGATTCTPCAAGTYSLSSNVASCSTCGTIAHATTVQCTTGSDQKIRTCYAGYYGNPGDVFCQTCGAGSITNTGTSAGASTCDLCTPGLYSVSSNVASCSTCGAGSITKFIYKKNRMMIATYTYIHVSCVYSTIHYTYII